jgi:hypothetical protein
MGILFWYIPVASLELTVGNPAYRDSTIIDGNNSGSCVRMTSHESNAGIFGFTIQHGSGTTYTSYGVPLTKGGGIKLLNATDVRIYNCNIENNKATEGGGISAKSSSAFLIMHLMPVEEYM